MKALRPVIQFVLSAAVFILWPFTFIAVYAFIESFARGTAMSFEQFYFFLVWIGGLLGIPALAASIFVPTAIIKKARWSQWVVIIGLIGGSITAGTLLTIRVPSDIAMSNWKSIATGTWQIGGPLIVALWNLWRLWKEPNQPLQRNASTGPVSNFESPARRG